MFQAQLLIREQSADTKVYSPWFPREGDFLRGTAEFVAGNGVLTVKVFTKNNEDTGNGTEIAGTSISLSSAGRGDAEWTTIKEMVRYEFTVGDAAGEWVLFRMLSPTWFDAVDAS